MDLPAAPWARVHHRRPDAVAEPAREAARVAAEGNADAMDAS